MALVALLLELAVGLGWLLQFVESSALELLSVFKIWFKDFRNVRLNYIAVECRIVSSDMYCLSGNLFSVLVQDFKL